MPASPPRASACPTSPATSSGFPPSPTASPRSPKDRPDIVALTHHYYFTGPPSNPKANINDLLHPDPRVTRDARIARDAAQKLGTHYRMTEGNTCYRGGKPGFSDVFAATLWSADYCSASRLARLLRRESSRWQREASRQLARRHAARRRAHHQPKAKSTPAPSTRPSPTSTASTSPSPPSTVFASLVIFAGGTMVPLTFTPGAVNATAYAAKLPTGQIRRRHHQQGRDPAAAHRSRRLQRRPRPHCAVAHIRAPLRIAKPPAIARPQPFRPPPRCCSTARVHTRLLTKEMGAPRAPILVFSLSLSSLRSE